MTTVTLEKKAMLVNLSISYWTGHASDERVGDELSKKHKTDLDVHKYAKVLIQPAALNLVKAARSKARAYHFGQTSPWIDGGTRVLPSALFFEYTEKMRELRGEYDSAVATFIKNYPGLKGEARKRLGDLFRDEDYPSVDTLKRKFGWDMGVLPIPSSGDWRVDLGAKANADMEKQIDARVKAATEVILSDLWQRLFAPIAALAAKMKDAEPVFRDSIIGNVKEQCALMEKMNVTGDAKLTAMVKKIESALGKFDPQTLRDDAKVRKQAASAADDILAQMTGYIGGK